MSALDFISDLGLATPWIGLALAATGIALLVWAIAWRSNKRPGWAYPAIGAAVFLGVAVLAGVSAYADEYPQSRDRPPDPGPAAPTAGYGMALPSDLSQGVHIEAEIAGSRSGIGVQPADIWLPPQYYTEPGRRFPIVYLYHGTPGVSDDWFEGGEATQSALSDALEEHPLILVAPTVSPPSVDSECVNGTAGNWDTYLSQDVINWSKSHLRLLGGSRHTAAAGLSMGGYCAQMLALRYPQLFSVSGNFSGTTGPDFAGGLPALFGPMPDLQQTIDSYDSSWLVENQRPSRSVSTWLAIGSGDEQAWIADQQRFAKLAASLGMDVQAQTVPGGHSFDVWADVFEQWLTWAEGKIA